MSDFFKKVLVVINAYFIITVEKSVSSLIFLHKFSDFVIL